MILTDKARYSVIGITYLVRCYNEGRTTPIKIVEISSKQGLKMPYLEQVFSKLRRGGFVKSVKGPGGGYVLAKTPESITVLDVLKCVEEKIKMTNCGECKERNVVESDKKCMNHDFWTLLTNHISTFLANVTIQQIVNDRFLKDVNEVDSCSVIAQNFNKHLQNIIH